MKIVIDLDSTIINTPKMLLNIYNYETNSKLEFNPNHKWDFEGLFPKEYNSRAYQLFTSDILYDFAEEFPNAINTINEIAKTHEVIIATKHHPSRIPNTQNWFDSRFKNVKIEYMDTFDKSIMSGDIFIDDRIDCLESVKDNFNFRICFGVYDWNKEWNGIRLMNWDDISKFINSLI